MWGDRVVPRGNFNNLFAMSPPNPVSIQESRITFPQGWGLDRAFSPVASVGRDQDCHPDVVCLDTRHATKEQNRGMLMVRRWDCGDESRVLGSDRAPKWRGRLALNFMKVFRRNVWCKCGGRAGRHSRSSWTQPTTWGLYAMSRIHQSFFVKGKSEGRLCNPPPPPAARASSRTRLQ